MGIENIILTENSLMLNNTMEMIKTSDPDIAINLTGRSNSSFQKLLKLKVIDNSSTYNLNHISTTLDLFDNLEPFINKHTILQSPRPIYFNSNPVNSDLSRSFSINVGIATNEELKTPILNLYYQSSISSIEDLLKIAKQPSQNFLNACAIYRSHGRGFNIWEINYNEQAYFRSGKKNSTLFVGSFSNFEGILYFWNTRALYPMHQCMWIPELFIETDKSILNNWTHYVNVGDNEILDYSEYLDNSVIINSSKYYFDDYISEWEDFFSFQTIFTEDLSLAISHPNEKLFSAKGYNVAIALEIRGLPHFIYPANSNMGNLFITHSDFYPESFSRISKVGLVTYHTQFEPERDYGIEIVINIPTESAQMDSFLEQFTPDLIIKKSEKSIIIERLLELVADSSGLELIRNYKTFNLLVKLTPKRLSRLISELYRNIAEVGKTENIIASIQESLNSLVTLTSDIYATLDRMFEICNVKAEERSLFSSYIELLWQKGILLRGRNFNCPTCNRNIWFLISELNNNLNCYCCKSPVQLPIFSDGRPVSDSFKLNELVAVSIDQGQFTTALVVAFLKRQKYYISRFGFALNVYENGSNAEMTDIDLLVFLGKNLGICEIKSDRIFDYKQAKKLISLSSKLGVRFIVFASLLSDDNNELVKFVEELNSISLNIPVFLLTKEALFDPNPYDLSSLIQIDSHTRNKFISGVFVVSKL
ncbi:hypothetical protein EHO58_18130 [Leptospira selangorensis]|uniref:hypothetical protein n=1 Tax=Leptospira selangorensis TaxID=2484982 RepID=UPI001083EBDC|nr:hypothetical protein [Leptospira selangorensis]TGK00382.1 hypothetical protein EHO58_18130 [Leptospira selangorensis]